MGRFSALAEQVCGMSLRKGVNSYKSNKALVERLVADALVVLGSKND